MRLCIHSDTSLTTGITRSLAVPSLSVGTGSPYSAYTTDYYGGLQDFNSNKLPPLMVKPQFIGFRSFVDVPFFAELSKYKLEEAKLSDARKSLTGHATPPLASQRPPALQLVAESFNYNENEHKNGGKEFKIPGELLNMNTIESFRDLDKIDLLRSEAEALGKQIKTGKVLENPSLLCKFLFLSFSDLKKYKFYYWLMFPVLAWTSLLVPANSDLLASAELDSLMSEVSQPFCIIKCKNGSRFATESLSTLPSNIEDDSIRIGVVDFGSTDALPVYIANLAALLSYRNIRKVSIYLYRRSGGSKWLGLEVGTVSEEQWHGAQASGWERNAQNKLVPKLTDISSLMNPEELANQAVNLNLKLMKWRAVPAIDLERIANSKCLLLGAGTLGSYVSRGLMAWGVRNITFVDSGTVSYSNPVRQPLYVHKDCISRAHKAEAAASALHEIFPGVLSTGHSLEILMAGHPITNEARQREEYEQLVALIKAADFVFLLMDSRESRWLPTVICQALRKSVINVALGFDSYLVMRHGIDRKLGCYFCNDVVAPRDSISHQTLDQMCTVTRPGCAMIASGHAVELMAKLAQTPELAAAPYQEPTILGDIPHQLRGFLSTEEIVKVWGAAFPSCSACGPSVEKWVEGGWEFVKRAVNDPSYITEISGLGDLQRQTEALSFDSDSDGELV